MRAVTFINADMGPGQPVTLRVLGSHIVGCGVGAESGDLVVDLGGDRLLPGLINAHDHLQLNSFPLPKYGRHYSNATQWIRDFNDRIGTGDDFIACKAIPRVVRLLHGGLKNLLSGVTTVAHHDPFYPALSNESYPTQVVEKYGWSHSLEIDGEAAVRSSYLRTPAGWPWILHAAEGVDSRAACELDRLDELGCLGPNTLLVHGVALDYRRRARLAAVGAGLIWCPTSNLHLFGTTATVTDLVDCGRVALGSDSRLTGARDLLDEVRVAATFGGFSDQTLESLVTATSARLLRLEDRGTLRVGARADLVVLPAGMPLSRASRTDLRLVMLGGEMRCGDPHYAAVLLPESRRVTLLLDSCTKCVERRVAALLNALGPSELGVDLPSATGRAA